MLVCVRDRVQCCVLSVSDCDRVSVVYRASVNVLESCSC